MASDLKKQAQNLIRQALEKLLPHATPGQTAATANEGTEAALAAKFVEGLDADALIDLYFECDDADERDVVFERIATLEQEKTNAFFEAMLQNDEDEYMRVAAAEVLAMRGNAAAKQALNAFLEDKQDIDLLEQALDALMRIDADGTKIQCEQIFYDRNCDVATRRLALLVLESADPQLALACAQKWIAELSQPEPRYGDLFEFAIGVVVRTPSQDGLALLEACMQRMSLNVVDTPDMDQDDRDAWLALLYEGIAMLRSALAPA